MVQQKLIELSSGQSHLPRHLGPNGLEPDMLLSSNILTGHTKQSLDFIFRKNRLHSQTHIHKKPKSCADIQCMINSFAHENTSFFIKISYNTKTSFAHAYQPNRTRPAPAAYVLMHNRKESITMMTPYEKEHRRYHDIVRDILTCLKGEGYRVFLPVCETSSWGYIYDGQTNRILTLSYGPLGSHLTFTTKANKICGRGYHCAGTVIGENFLFLGEVHKDDIQKAIQYGQNRLFSDLLNQKDPNPKSMESYLYPDLSAFLSDIAWCQPQEL